MKLAIFDWDGTLSDSVHMIVAAFEAAFVRGGLQPPPTASIRHTIGLPVHESLLRMHPELAPARLDELSAFYSEEYLSRVDRIRLFPGVEVGLSRLSHAGFVLAVATGKSSRGIERALRMSNTAGLFRAVRSAQTTAPKPNPLMINEILGELGVRPAEAVLIGDTSHDRQLAANAGVDFLAVSYGAHSPVELFGEPDRSRSRMPALHHDFDAVVAELLSRRP